MQEKPKTAKIAYELRKLRERGATKKLKNTHYYQVTEEEYVWLYYSLFNYLHFAKPLLSKANRQGVKKVVNNQAKTEQAYSMIDDAVCIIKSELRIAVQKIKNVNFIYVFEKLNIRFTRSYALPHYYIEQTADYFD